jgi:hypothetical protein
LFKSDFIYELLNSHFHFTCPIVTHSFQGVVKNVNYHKDN